MAEESLAVAAAAVTMEGVAIKIDVRTDCLICSRTVDTANDEFFGIGVPGVPVPAVICKRCMPHRMFYGIAPKNCQAIFNSAMSDLAEEAIAARSKMKIMSRRVPPKRTPLNGGFVSRVLLGLSRVTRRLATKPRKAKQRFPLW